MRTLQVDDVVLIGEQVEKLWEIGRWPQGQLGVVTKTFPTDGWCPYDVQLARSNHAFARKELHYIGRL